MAFVVGLADPPFHSLGNVQLAYQVVLYPVRWVASIQDDGMRLIEGWWEERVGRAEGVGWYRQMD